MKKSNRSRYSKALGALACFLGSTSLSTMVARAQSPIPFVNPELLFPSNWEMTHWVEVLSALGRQNEVFPGIRQAGTPADDYATRWLTWQLRLSGLKDVRREPVPIIGWQPTEYGLTVHTGSGDQTLESWPIFYASFVGGSGRLKAEMVYVGLGFPAHFAGRNVAGKIVVADMISPVIPQLLYDNLKADALETYDPDDTFAPGAGHPYWAFANQVAYHLAAAGGAAGFIGINTHKADGHRFFQNANALADPRQGVLGGLPGLYVSNATGTALRPLAAAGAEATLVSAGETPWTQTYNVVGTLPGESSDIIQISTHSDGGAVNDGSGSAAVLALARHYALLRLFGHKPRKTLQFVITGGHFTAGAGIYAFIEEHADDVLQDVIANVTVEQVGKHYDLVGGRLIDTGLVDPRGLFTSDNALFPIVSDAVHRRDLRRTFILPVTSAIASGTGEGWAWHTSGGLRSVWHISPVEYMQSTADTLEKLDVGELRKVMKALADIVDGLADAL